MTKPDSDSSATSADGTRYYIYENWRAGPHKAVIHKGSCSHCKEGKGLVGEYDLDNAEWHGPFDDLETARRRQQSMNAKEKQECKMCINRTLL